MIAFIFTQNVAALLVSMMRRMESMGRAWPRTAVAAG